MILGQFLGLPVPANDGAGVPHMADVKLDAVVEEAQGRRGAGASASGGVGFTQFLK